MVLEAKSSFVVIFTPMHVNIIIIIITGVVACKLVNMLPVFCITCSIYSLVAMSFERLRAIVHHTRQQLSLASARTISTAIWIFAGNCVCTVINIRWIVIKQVCMMQYDAEEDYFHTSGLIREIHRPSVLIPCACSNCTV